MATYVPYIGRLEPASGAHNRHVHQDNGVPARFVRQHGLLF